MKINMCCGSRDFGDGWINIDRFEAGHITHAVTDLSKIPQLKNDSADLIYCSHAIGYFDREEIKPILAEWRRILKSEGVLRIATPDFTEIANLYCSGKYTMQDFLGLLYGRWGSDSNRIYFKTTYDFASLKQTLQENGFGSVCRYDFTKTEHSQIHDFSKAHLPKDWDAIETGNYIKGRHTLVSLNVECKKSNHNGI